MKETVHLSKANRERLEKYHSDANLAIEAALNKAEGNRSGITIDYAKVRTACEEALAAMR
jgi:hypothetical protein